MDSSGGSVSGSRCQASGGRAAAEIPQQLQRSQVRRTWSMGSIQLRGTFDN